MREIKFRAWLEEDEKMFPIDKIHFGDNQIVWYITIWDEHSYPPNVDIWENYKIMQFTGLKDKNGKEIYEGDIVKSFQAEKGFIIFEDGTFWLIFLNEEMKAIARYAEVPHIQTSLGTQMRGINGKYTEIIGNIYENPELLEGKDVT